MMGRKKLDIRLNKKCIIVQYTGRPMTDSVMADFFIILPMDMIKYY